MNTNFESKYYRRDLNSILNYAKKLIGKNLSSVLKKEIENTHKEYQKVKGKFGQYIEKFYFGFENNSEKEPDFKEVGLELKTTPLKRTSKGLLPKERLVLNIINYEEIVREEWETSSFLKKNSLLLLIFYLYEKDKSFLEFLIKYVSIWRLKDKDFEIIRQDWEKIVKKIQEGKAHELSEGDTFYLSACRKGIGNGKDLRVQPNSIIKAPQRAFSLKQKYVNFIISNISESESLIKLDSDLRKESFENIIYNKFKPFLNKEVKEIEKLMKVKINFNSKDYYSNLARRMLGIKGKRIEEFEKADVNMKIIRLKESGIPSEDMSFPMFRFKEIINQDWEDSKFFEYLEKKFLFVIYRTEGDKIFFKKALFWNIPAKDLREARKVWEDTKKVVKKGVKIWESSGRIFNNLPKKSENFVAHVRPHARNRLDVDILPNGIKLTKQCFWLSSKYLKTQIENN